MTSVPSACAEFATVFYFVTAAITGLSIAAVVLLWIRWWR
jgi:hypothetical protein